MLDASPCVLHKQTTHRHRGVNLRLSLERRHPLGAQFEVIRANVLDDSPHMLHEQKEALDRRPRLALPHHRGP